MDGKTGLSSKFMKFASLASAAVIGCVAVHGLSGFFAAASILPFDALTLASSTVSDVMVNAFS